MSSLDSILLTPTLYHRLHLPPLFHFISFYFMRDDSRRILSRRKTEGDAGDWEYACQAVGKNLFPTSRFVLLEYGVRRGILILLMLVAVWVFLRLFGRVSKVRQKQSITVRIPHVGPSKQLFSVRIIKVLTSSLSMCASLPIFKQSFSEIIKIIPCDKSVMFAIINRWFLWLKMYLD